MSVPHWAHVPLIHGPDGKKLSKRHGALGVEAYQDQGYLPSGLRNYLVKLGWSKGNRELFLSDQDISEIFTLDGINTAPARLDFDKMSYINGHHIAHISDDVLMAAAQPFLVEKAGGEIAPKVMDRIHQALPSLRPRARTLLELADAAEYLYIQRPLVITGKTVKTLRRDGVNHLVKALTSRLEALEDIMWTAEALQTLLTEFIADHGIGFGKIGAPIRAALTAGTPSPDLHLVLAFLGREEVLGRLDDARPFMG